MQDDKKVEVELLHGVDPSKLTWKQKYAIWEQKILEGHQDKCANCGSTHKARVKMIVPKEAGGQLTEENGTVTCRACELASKVVSREVSGSAERPVNFWVSHRLFKTIKELNGFSSTGALIRFLMNQFVLDAARFDDLAQWQDEGTDTKVSVWVDHKIYETFKSLVNTRGMTVTDALKSLIRMYEDETDQRVKAVSKT